MRLRFFFTVFLLVVGFFVGVFVVYRLMRPVTSQDSQFSWSGLFSSAASSVPFLNTVETSAGENVSVVAVMVDNHPDARAQQTGLSKASIVYEAIAEGGITRYLAIFPLDGDATAVGPVRSARPYFIDWASEYNGFYVHAGGSDTALNDLISNSSVYNIDGLAWEGVTFASKGISVPDVLHSTTDMLVNRLSAFVQPHNLFLDLVYLRILGDSLDRTLAPKFSHFLFSDAPVTGANGSSFSIDFSFPSYFVQYQYDAPDHVYHRFLAKEPAKDLAGPIQPKNVIVELTPAVQVDDYGRLSMDTRSGGKAWVFTDGTVREGVWQYDAIEQRTRFFEPDGVTEIALAPGQTWIEVINKEGSLVIGK